MKVFEIYFICVIIRLIIEEHVLIITMFYCHNECYAETMSNLCRILDQNEVPNESTVC